MLRFKKIEKKYRSLSVTQKSVIWYTLAVMIQNGILFLITPLYTRMLTGSQYGVFSVYQSWQQIVSIIAILSIDRCITVGFMKFQNQQREFLSSVQGLMTLLVLFFLFITCFFSEILEQIIGLPIYIIITMFVVALMNNTLANWSWYQRYQYSYIKLAAVTIFSTVLMQVTAVLAIYFLPITSKGEVLIISMSIVRLLIYGTIYINVFVQGKKFFDREHWRFALKYSIAVVPHALAQIILNSSDRIMIDKMCGREDTAYYGVTYTAAMVLNIILTSVSSAIQPWFFEKIKQKQYDEIRKQTNTLLLFAACLAIIVSLFAPEILNIMAPVSYHKALWIFPAVAASVFFNGMYLCFSNFESYYEKPFYFSIATTVGAVVNVVLNYLLIPKFGFIVAGYTTLVCYMIFAIMHYFFMWKICKDKIGGKKVFDIRFILQLSVIVIVLSIGVIVLYHVQMMRYLLIACAVFLVIIRRKSLVRIFW